MSVSFREMPKSGPGKYGVITLFVHKLSCVALMARTKEAALTLVVLRIWAWTWYMKI
jgi:hypothetical protein